jgi:hypothetical protein
MSQRNRLALIILVSAGLMRVADSCSGEAICEFSGFLSRHKSLPVLLSSV